MRANARHWLARDPYQANRRCRRSLPLNRRLPRRRSTAEPEKSTEVLSAGGCRNNRFRRMLLERAPPPAEYRAQELSRGIQLRGGVEEVAPRWLCRVRAVADF